MPAAEIFFEAFELAAPEAAPAILDTTAGALTPAMAGGVGAGITNAAQLGGEYLGGLGSTGQGIVQAGVTGAGGAGAAGVNEAQVAAQQANALSSGAGEGVKYSQALNNFPPAAQQLPGAFDTAGFEGINSASVAPEAGQSALSKGWDTATKWMEAHPYYTAAGAYLGANKLGLFDPKKQSFNDTPYDGILTKYRMSPDFQARHADPTQFQYTPKYAGGGIMDAGRNPVEQMSNQNAIGANTGFPQANMHSNAYATPYQTPISQNMLSGPGDTGVDPYSGEQNMAEGGIARYGFGGFIGDAVQGVGNGVADVVHGAGNVVNNALDGRISMANPEMGDFRGLRQLAGMPTADQVARKYSSTTLAQNGASPQQYQYSPQYAEGGVAHFRTGNLASTLDYYNGLIGGNADAQMAEARTPAGGKGDAGIMRDTDPDTAYLAAGPAAGVRMGKINAKANMQGRTLPRIDSMGKINLKPQGVQQAAASGSSLDPESAAQGGIMHYSLGSYAAGGNPRLLKGPGDGMSDNIPATIAGKQPARLADGEFVIPADVVSHLGNGSTDAGAKKLHHMMDTVRKARTGNPKQGKQINPDKYLPK